MGVQLKLAHPSQAISAINEYSLKDKKVETNDDEPNVQKLESISSEKQETNLVHFGVEKNVYVTSAHVEVSSCTIDQLEGAIVQTEVINNETITQEQEEYIHVEKKIEE